MSNEYRVTGKVVIPFAMTVHAASLLEAEKLATDSAWGSREHAKPRVEVTRVLEVAPLKLAAVTMPYGVKNRAGTEVMYVGSRVRVRLLPEITGAVLAIWCDPDHTTEILTGGGTTSYYFRDDLELES